LSEPRAKQNRGERAQQAQPADGQEAAPNCGPFGVSDARRLPGPPPTFNLRGTIGGRYELLRMLGEGGFGKVYLAYEPKTLLPRAVKTIRPEFLLDPRSRQAFKREAQLWVDLDDHPFILAARLVWEYSGQIFVEMEYVASDPKGRVTLADHLKNPNGQVGQEVALSRAIQFCYGMEHAISHGIRCHRDIKPANILITWDQDEAQFPGGTIKISDFGLAVAAEKACREGLIAQVTRDRADVPGLSILDGQAGGICGTPGYIAPEVATGASPDERSDIYSFGVVLWQMAFDSPVSPFHVSNYADVQDYQRKAFERQVTGHIPAPRPYPTQAIVVRCLQPDPKRRYPGFGTLRRDLERAYLETVGQSFRFPTIAEHDADFWCNKGTSLAHLGRHEEALAPYTKALELAPQSEALWNNIGITLRILGRFDESLLCASRALEMDPRNANYWTNKGNALDALGRPEEALECHSKSLEIEPTNFNACVNKGNALAGLGRHEEALASYGRAIECEPRNTMGWFNLGNALKNLGRLREAIASYTKTVEIDPLHAGAWFNGGDIYLEQKQFVDAANCYLEGLKVFPGSPLSWDNRGVALRHLGQLEEAILCHSEALKIDPSYASAWANKSAAHDALGDKASAARCLRRFLELARDDPSLRQLVPGFEELLAELEGTGSGHIQT
jgi:tetratricopeptide (TPR) repeat protein